MNGHESVQSAERDQKMRHIIVGYRDGDLLAMPPDTDHAVADAAALREAADMLAPRPAQPADSGDDHVGDLAYELSEEFDLGGDEGTARVVIEDFLEKRGLGLAVVTPPGASS